MPEPEALRILIIRPSALGDVCRSVPVLVSLRRAYPDATIHWLVQDSFADAVRHHPDLSGVVEFPRRRFGRLWRPEAAAGLWRWLGDLRRARYDLVVECQGLFRSGFFAWATRAPRRVGFANARELGWLGLTERHGVPHERHTVDRMLELVRMAGVEPVRDLRLYAPPARAGREHGAGRPYAVIAPTSRWPGKRWPAKRFAALARHVLSRGLDVALVGSASERDQCGPLLELAAAEPRLHNRIGATTVGDLMGLIESASLVVANDSAALHMAVGFDRPLIGLYGPTRVDLVGPYGRAADVIQHVEPGEPLDHKDERLGRALMERIGVDEVCARVDRSLERSGAGHAAAHRADPRRGHERGA